MRIARAEDAAAVKAAAHLFDGPPIDAAVDTFLASPAHHLLLAHGDDDAVIGMISGVETTHPDKGTEMFLYELEVVPEARRAGVATALVDALAAIAKAHGCYGMWVGTEHDNVAARATYTKTATEEEAFVLFNWSFTD
jgi:ribosomal protein S18 acetylase RimI-like enzyme